MKINKPFKILSICTLFIFLAACGDSDDSTNVIIQNPNDPQNQEQGTFSTPPMVVINNNVVTNVQAVSSMTVRGDDVTIRVRCSNAPRNVIHKQIIHKGTRCPTMADDSNGDGIIDWEETQRAAGPTLMTLDNDLESQEDQGFPSGPNYNYTRRASLERIRDILPPGEDFVLAGRVAIIYGVSPSTSLPPTVATVNDEPQNVNVPISCAVIQQDSAPEIPEAPESPETPEMPEMPGDQETPEEQS